MNRTKSCFTPLNWLYLTQFLSSFADNINFFLILGIVTRRGAINPEGYITNIQIGFLAAYVILAPIVGAFADKNAKSVVLLIGNLFKGVGIFLLLFGVHPMVCYAILGIGAVIYSPGKYGILSELTHSEDELLRANAKVEGSTIFAILLGTVSGGFLASISDLAGIISCLGLYVASLALSLLIPKKAGNPKVQYIESSIQFLKDTRTLFYNTKGNFSLIATGAFWLTAAVLRIALIAWLPVNLGIKDTNQQSMIIGVTAIGVIFGAAITPKLVKPGRLHQSFVYGFLMVTAVMVAAFIHELWLTVIMLLLIGCFGGVFLIPMNTMLQDIGKDLIGSGKTIAIQNFVENLLTISGLFVFTTLTYLKVPIDLNIVIIGSILLLFVLYLAVKVRKIKPDESQTFHRSVS